VTGPPKFVVVGPHRYRVTVDRAAVDRVSVEGGERVVGACDRQRLEIVADPELAPSQLADTVLHEVLHAAFDLIGAGEDIAADVEERLVLRLAPVLLQVVRANPSLVEYLTA
jgi:hypothetical protein